jgi:Spy/CpxP family protein refolding chaperone
MKSLSALLVAASFVAMGIVPQFVDGRQDIKTTGGVLAERIQDLDLSDEQEAKIAEIRTKNRPKVAEAKKSLASILKEEVEKIGDVLTPEQKTKLAATKEERREHRQESLAEGIAHLEELDLTDAEMMKIGEFRKEYRPKFVKALEGLKGLLSDDQRKIREEALKADKKRREIITSLKLSDDQKAKVEAVGKEFGGLFRDEMAKIRDFLTEGQKEKLEELKDERQDRVRDRRAHWIANLKDLELSKEQVSKIMDIRREYRPKVHEAGNMLRAIVRDELEMIVATIKR